MAFQSRYLFTASMDIDPAREALFNEVYDTEHCPMLQEVPGVVSIARFRKAELTMIIGGERKAIVLESEPRYTAMYEIDSPRVLVSDAWAAAVDRGRWPGQVRPHTSNRKHILWERI